MPDVGRKSGHKRHKQVSRAWMLLKHAFHLARGPLAADRQRILFILGCQRSGTTLVTRIFERDWNARVYNEHSELSSDDVQFNIRLNDLNKVHKTIRRSPYPLVVAKPLVESHRPLELLNHFENCRILWLYRSYFDVVSSDLAIFGERNGIENIRPIVNAEQGNWRSTNVSQTVRTLLEQHFSEDMNPVDAAALFWYSRNSHFFDTGLDKELPAGRVMLLPYQQLVTAAENTIKGIYRLVDLPYPNSRIIAEVDPFSLGKGNSRKQEISDDVRSACDSLLGRLDQLADFQRAVSQQ